MRKKGLLQTNLLKFLVRSILRWEVSNFYRWRDLGCEGYSESHGTETKTWFKIFDWSPSIRLFWPSFSHFVLRLLDGIKLTKLFLSSDFAYIEYRWRHSEYTCTSQPCSRDNGSEVGRIKLKKLKPFSIFIKTIAADGPLYGFFL